jgi:protein required for attachment to host cells
MKPTITWILIADGARARILRHEGPGKGVQQVEGLEFSQGNKRAQDIMADRPGRSFQSAGDKRSAYEPQTDPVEKREADFVQRLAEYLETERQRGAFDRLVLVASPIALGALRASLNPHLDAMVMAELNKDLTKVPNNEMGKHLEGVLAV